MDGAAKFVRGDAIAGLLITVINIIGGLAIGLLRHGMAFGDAAATFTTLTVGDGLVSQIPALLVSTAAGIVVTKGGVEGPADAALMRQLGGSPKPLALAGGAAAVLALMPGLPALPFLALAGLAGAGAWMRWKHPSVPVATDAIPAVAPDRGADHRCAAGGQHPAGIGVRPAGVWPGARAPRLTEQIKALRRSIAAEMGYRAAAGPYPRQHGARRRPVCDPAEGGRGRASGELRAAMLLAMNPAGGLPDLPGERHGGTRLRPARDCGSAGTSGRKRCSAAAPSWTPPAS